MTGDLDRDLWYADPTEFTLQAAVRRSVPAVRRLVRSVRVGSCAGESERGVVPVLHGRHGPRSERVRHRLDPRSEVAATR